MPETKTKQNPVLPKGKPVDTTEEDGCFRASTKENYLVIKQRENLTSLLGLLKAMAKERENKVFLPKDEIKKRAYAQFNLNPDLVERYIRQLLIIGRLELVEENEKKLRFSKNLHQEKQQFKKVKDAAKQGASNAE